MPENADKKAELFLASGEELTFENIVSMYEAMIGRKVTQAELAEMKDEWEAEDGWA